MNSANWFSITHAASDTAEVLIYDAIGSYGVTAKQFIGDLQKITAKKIARRIHSPGGSIFDGSAIANARTRHRATVTTDIDGLAASMATVVALSGNPVHMAANGMFLIHMASGQVGGSSKEMRQLADLIDKLTENIINTYAQKTGLPRKRLRSMMEAETSLNAAEARAHGFINAIHREQKAAADELLSATEMPHARLCPIAPDQASERLPVNQIENLGEDVAAGIHGPPSCGERPANSNPSHPALLINHFS